MGKRNACHGQGLNRPRLLFAVEMIVASGVAHSARCYAGGTPQRGIPTLRRAPSLRRWMWRGNAEGRVVKSAVICGKNLRSCETRLDFVSLCLVGKELTL